MCSSPLRGQRESCVCVCVSHPGLCRPTGPNGSKRAPGGTAPGGRMSGIPLEGSKPERGYPDLNGSTIIPPLPRDLRGRKKRDDSSFHLDECLITWHDWYCLKCSNQWQTGLFYLMEGAKKCLFAPVFKDVTLMLLKYSRDNTQQVVCSMNIMDDAGPRTTWC